MWQSIGSTVGLFVATSGSAYDDWAGVAQTLFVAVALPGRVAGCRRASRRRGPPGDGAPDVAYVRHGLVYPGLLTSPGGYRWWWRSTETTSSRVTAWAQASDDDPSVPWDRTTQRRGTGSSSPTSWRNDPPSLGTGGRPWSCQRDRSGVGVDASGEPRWTRRLIFLGHPHTPWHGTDKLVDLARRLPDWRVDLVGPTAADLLGHSPTTSAPTVCSGQRYAPPMAEADLASVRSAMDRAGITEASPLKVREYLGAGLPTRDRLPRLRLSRRCGVPAGAAEHRGQHGEAAARIPAFADRWARSPRAGARSGAPRRPDEGAVRLRFLETRLAARSGRPRLLTGTARPPVAGRGGPAVDDRADPGQRVRPQLAIGCDDRPARSPRRTASRRLYGSSPSALELRVVEERVVDDRGCAPALAQRRDEREDARERGLLDPAAVGGAEHDHRAASQVRRASPRAGRRRTRASPRSPRDRRPARVAAGSVARGTAAGRPGCSGRRPRRPGGG